MKRVLITGMSATGKSSVIGELAARGYKAVDADQPTWSHTVDQEWIWREQPMRDLLATEDAEIVFVAGCCSNQGRFPFDTRILLSAPVPLMLERLATRTTNVYGKDPAEVEEILQNTRTIEPLLRRNASLEIDTSAPLNDVVQRILDFTLRP